MRASGRGDVSLGVLNGILPILRGGRTPRHPARPASAFATPAAARHKARLATILLLAILGAGLCDLALLLLEAATTWNRQAVHILTICVRLPMLLAALWLLRLLLAPADEPGAMLADLRREKEAAETSNLAKARYLANVSHEIRSPLNAIYGYAQLIEQEASIRPRDAARVIRRCAEHMTGLVESLLDLSQAESGLLRLRSEVVRLPDFIEQIVLMMRPAAQARGLEFRYEENGVLPEFVRTDQSRFRQALINLLTNAIKFTDRGHVTLRLSYRGQTATFEVIDTGPGIAPEDQRRIFDPYERLDSGKGEPAGGVGLGLPISRAIVEMLGGNLELDSSPGSGSCFRIVMMLGAVAGMQVPAAAQRRICGHDGPQRRVLVVDDDADQRSFLAKFLTDCGLEVTEAGDGETAAELGRHQTFDLAILDISLPGISGWDVAAQLRESAGPQLAVVMASANAQEFHRPDHHRPEHDLFFIKPYRLDELAEAVGALLKLNWTWELAGDAAPPAPVATAPSAAAQVHIVRLQELLRIGHVRGIEAEIALLDALPDVDRELVGALYSALDEFDLTGMARVLEAM